MTTNNCLVGVRAFAFSGGCALVDIGNGQIAHIPWALTVPVIQGDLVKPAMTAAEKTLIEACIEQGISSGVRPFIEAVKAERAPPDPVVMFQQAYDDYPEPCPAGCPNGVYKAGICGCALRFALKAYDATKGEKS